MQASDAFPEKAVAGSPEKGQKEALPGILSLRPSPCLSALFPETPTKWRVQRMFPAKSWSLGLFVPPRELELQTVTAPLSDLSTLHGFSRKMSDVVKKVLTFDWYPQRRLSGIKTNRNPKE
ncbi:hypothetical protein CapIbe_002437 [Capra ibex]